MFFNYEKFSERWYMGGDEKDVGHNIAKLVPRETYYPSHSEWFALVNGRRDPYSASDTYWQYCYSNKELAKEVAKKLIEIFDQRPNLTNYAIGANDGWEKNWCECSDCTRLGNDTDELLTFANNVAAELKKKYPDKKLTILSYHSIYFPPQSNIKADPMVDVMFCRETSMMAPLDLNLKLPTGYNAITHNTYTQSWLDNFKSYIQKASVKTVSIWEWNCIAADKAAWAEIPWVQGNVATRNQKLWKDNGASYIYYDQGPSSTYRENRTSFAVRWPLWYVSSKGMWDGSLTGEDILMDACQKLFGNAANEMFAYYKALADSSELCRSTNTICWVPPEIPMRSIPPPVSRLSTPPSTRQKPKWAASPRCKRNGWKPSSNTGTTPKPSYSLLSEPPPGGYPAGAVFLFRLLFWCLSDILVPGKGDRHGQAHPRTIWSPLLPGGDPSKDSGNRRPFRQDGHSSSASPFFPAHGIQLLCQRTVFTAALLLPYLVFQPSAGDSAALVFRGVGGRIRGVHPGFVCRTDAVGHRDSSAVFRLHRFCRVSFSLRGV